jgi:hypothetical protein
MKSSQFVPLAAGNAVGITVPSSTAQADQVEPF